MSKLLERARQAAAVMRQKHMPSWDSGIPKLLDDLVAEIERLQISLAEARGHGETMPCGHNSHWLVYGNPVDVDSERHCLFCEVEQLRQERNARYNDLQIEQCALETSIEEEQANAEIEVADFQRQMQHEEGRERVCEAAVEWWRNRNVQSYRESFLELREAAKRLAELEEQ